jgi:hypothetical protein
MVKEHPEAYGTKADFRIGAVRLRDQVTSRARTVLLVLLAAAVLVFVIACSNVANLLRRTVRREGEPAIRAALGASSGGLRRTLPAESLLLCGVRSAECAADGCDSGPVRVAVFGAGAPPERRFEHAVDRCGIGAGRGGTVGVCAAAPSAGRSHGLTLASGSVRITGSANRRLRALR